MGIGMFMGYVGIAMVGAVVAGSALIEFYFFRREEYGKAFLKRIQSLSELLKAIGNGQNRAN